MFYRLDPHGKENEAIISPIGPHEISVVIEFTLKHLRYHLTDVPP